MIDHVLGRPSIRSRKVQVFAAVSFWSFYLYKGDRNGPPLLRRLSKLLSPRLTAWQTVVITLLWLYVSRNFGKLLGLECPEPLANLYTRSYFRATWITTALDAGFWSAMRVRKKWLRDLLSILFTCYYLVCAEQADEKVRKVRAVITVEHLRVSWNKGTTPYLEALTRTLRPRLTRYGPRKIRIPRPAHSAYNEPVMAWLYWNGSLAALKKQRAVVVDIPGGGFVAMDPRNHDDKLLGWASKSQLPVLSVDYRKAPEFPYPYALNECFDVYQSIIGSRGRCIGLSGEVVPRVIVSGDSAGGNLAVGMTLMVLQSGSTETRRFMGEQQLPPPEGVALIYPALDMNIGNWMTDEQMGFIRERRVRKTNEGVLRRKTDHYRKIDPVTPVPSDDEDSGAVSPQGKSSKAAKRPKSTGTAIFTGAGIAESPKPQAPSPEQSAKQNSVLSPTLPKATTALANGHPTASSKVPAHQIKTRVMVSSLLSYFGDRILTPEMMRAMIILYVGPHHRPDFTTDYLLSPVLAPDDLLARFPRTFFLTGERDPLVDDTVIFAGRIRQAKRVAARDREELGLEVRGPGRKKRRAKPSSKRREGGQQPEANDEDDDDEEEDPDWVNMMLIPGISHGFLQFVSVFPEGWKYIFRTARWMRDVVDDAEYNEEFARENIPSTLVTPAAETPLSMTTNLDDSGQESKTSVLSTLGRPSLLQRRANSDKHDSERPQTAGASSEDDERPLEMSRTKRSSPTTSSPNPNTPPLTSSTSTFASSDPAKSVGSVTDTEEGGVSQPSSTSGTSSAAHGVVPIQQVNSEAAAAAAALKIKSNGQMSKGDRGPPKGTLKMQQRRRRKSNSLRALTSEEDLLKRRMLGLTGLLTRGGDDAPPTP